MPYVSPYTGQNGNFNILLKAETTLSDSGKFLYLKDTTGMYDSVNNPGGWGSPNAAMNDMTSMIIEIALPGNPDFQYGISVSVPTTVNQVWTITPNQIGLPVDSVFPDGMYTIRLLLKNDSNEYITPLNKYVLLAHAAKCCVYNKLANTTDCDCTCSDDSKSIEALNLYSMYQSMLYNAAMGKIENVNNLLSCIQSECGCGC